MLMPIPYLYTHFIAILKKPLISTLQYLAHFFLQMLVKMTFIV